MQAEDKFSRLVKAMIDQSSESSLEFLLYKFNPSKRDSKFARANFLGELKMIQKAWFIKDLNKVHAWMRFEPIDIEIVWKLITGYVNRQYISADQFKEKLNYYFHLPLDRVKVFMINQD